MRNGNANGTGPAQIEGGGILCLLSTFSGGPGVPGGWQGANIRVENCTVTANTATRGGGLHTNKAGVRMAKCTFHRNSAANGGAMYLSTTTSRMHNTVFTRNVAANGGAVFMIGIGGDLAPVNADGTVASQPFCRFANCRFFDNQAEFGGGFFFFEGSTAGSSSGRVGLVNCTLALNRAFAAGGGLYSLGLASGSLMAGAQVRNSILWANVAPNGPEFWGQHYFGYCNVGQPVTGPACLNLDPQFVNLAAGDLHLAGSSAVDNGAVPALPRDELDLDGDGNLSEVLPLDLDLLLRQQGNGVDRGAFER